VDYALKAGADIIVNTDGDNQYFGGDIPALIRPILTGQADVVLGDRQTWNLKHFSWIKRILQRVGSRVVSSLSATHVPDAVSGFRAISRAAAIKLNVISSFSYTIETLIQCGRAKLAVTSVPIRTNPSTRPSRLFRSIPQFLRMSGATMLRAYALHRPLMVFVSLGLCLLGAGFLPMARFLYFSILGDGAGHIQSLILGTALTVIGSSCFILGLLADLIAANRKLLEINLEKTRELESQIKALCEGRLTISQTPSSAEIGASDYREPATPVPLGEVAGPPLGQPLVTLTETTALTI
jgi:hypothetical protein